MVFKVKFVDISLMVVIVIILWKLTLPALSESDLKHAHLAVAFLTKTTGSYDPDTVIVHLLQSWKVWLYGIIFTGVIYSLNCMLLQPTNKVKRLGEVGYLAEKGMNKKDMANRLRRDKLSVDMPPVYTNGLNLAVFRGEDGRSHIIDGYCPHMGAHMAVGGQVKGNCLVCPFHGWKFKGESGKCVDIPYSDAKIPDGAKVKSHHCLERNNLIYIWYHAEGIEPYWEPPEVQQITEGGLTYVGKIEHEVNVHVEEIPENSADLSHIDVLHSPFMESGVDLRFTSSTFWNFVKHVWNSKWYPCEKAGEKHMAFIDMTHRLSIFGKEVPLLDTRMDIKQYGPGLTYVTLTYPFGTAVYIHSLTTIAPMLQQTRFTCYVHWLLPTAIGRMLLHALAVQFERDIMIWNNKFFCMKPLFAKSKSDSAIAMIAKHRKWFSQFYSENSTRLCSKHDTLDW